MRRCRRRRGPGPSVASVVTTALALAVALMLSACGGSGGQHGSVSVLYAGSLEQVMDHSIGPAFQRATGYTFSGYPAGSDELANEIRGKVRRGDVFISAAPASDVGLRGAANGSWVSWYAPFASSALVLGYNPHSRFAKQLRSSPWYRVVGEPGFRLGFTDPKLDPKGALTVAVLQAAARRYHEPGLAKLTTAQGALFPEQDLVGRLQSGQLDAGFFYTVEANAAKIPTVPLGPTAGRSVYTITILNRAPDGPGARAFVRFVLSAQGRALLSAAGLTLRTQPVANGSGLPASLRTVIRPG